MSEPVEPSVTDSATDSEKGAAFDPTPVIAEELGLPATSIRAVVRLMAEGATVPFIARYRKEATGGLDEVQIRNVGERFEYLTELEARRASVIAEIRAQGKLTPELLARLQLAPTKAELEDLYLPFKPKRKTRGSIAAERGLSPLAELMWSQPGGEGPEQAAARFVAPVREVPDAAAALAGARDICAERLAEDADLRKYLREAYQREGTIRVAKRTEFQDKATKFDMYASYEEAVAKVPSHRFLAIRRGESEEILYARVLLDTAPHLPFVKSRIPLRGGTPWQGELEQVVRDSLDRLIAPQVAAQVRVELKLKSDQEAIQVFAQNLRELLLSAPYGAWAVLGIDPGQRTGCKCAVVDGTGKLLAHDTIYLVQGDQAVARGKETLRRLCQQHGVKAVAVGNGTHGRETEAFVRASLAEAQLAEVLCVSVNEAGASIYSASDAAREEFPELDLTVRGAISIARRLQDPLAELVKIEPKSIGVGQYQHDVLQSALEKKLDEVVESCVNSVGVELNTASAQLLSRVAGIGGGLAKRIVLHRNEHGPFKSRRALLEVSGVGPKTFEQAAGFLRIRGGENPLDQSAVHPERYALVERMAADIGVPLASVVGSAALLRRLDLSKYRDKDVGDYTLGDILAELDKPGRDPRRVFEPPKFRDDIRELSDLKPDLVLEGVVTNVAAFGAFVDVGVHQDGLVHVSELADHFVKDPHAVVKVGDRVTVRVLSVDLERKRISLSAKRGKTAGASPRPDAGAGTGSSAPGAGKRPGADARPPARAGRSDARDARRPSANPNPGGNAGADRARFQNNPFADLLKKA
jgi:protein Tex